MKVNDFVIKFANVNGSGSASANSLFAKAVFRMGVPVSPKNIFPSNIQGLPTWFEVRVNGYGYLGRREGIDLMVAMNPQSWADDLASIVPGGYLLYDSTFIREIERDDIKTIGVPLTKMCNERFTVPRERQLFKNVAYVGALTALLDMDFEVVKGMVSEQFKGKEKLIEPNIDALELGRQYSLQHFDCPLDVRVETSDAVGNQILMEGNAAVGLGCVYAGAQTKGRGTRGKKWVSTKGNFFGSIFFHLKYNFPPFNEFSTINETSKIFSVHQGEWSTIPCRQKNKCELYAACNVDYDFSFKHDPI